MNVKFNSIINKLWINQFKKNKLKNICAILGIALTTILFFSVYFISYQVYQNQKDKKIEIAGWSADAVVKNAVLDDFKNIQNDKNVANSGRLIYFGDLLDESISNKMQVQFNDVNVAKWNYCDLLEGSYPENENEVVVSTAFLESKGLQEKIGQEFEISFRMNDKIYNKTVIMSGYYKSRFNGTDMVLISDEYANELLDGINSFNDRNQSTAGTLQIEIKFTNKSSLKKNTEKLQDSGELNENALVKLNSNLVHNIDKEMVGVILVICVVFLLVGYLLIYNIYYISVIKDIHFWGLLKIIGFDRMQLKFYLAKTIIMHFLIGILLGILCGNLLLHLFLSYILKYFNYQMKIYSTSINVYIFTIIFVFITVYVSIKKPLRIAMKKSAVEAKGYEINKRKKTRRKPLKNGGKIYVMAYRNLSRNGKRTKFVICSMVLCLFIIQLTFSIVEGFSADKFVEEQLISDFSIGNKTFYSRNFQQQAPCISDEVKDKLEEINGSAGFLYNWNNIVNLYDQVQRQKQLEKNNIEKDLPYFSTVYGITEKSVQFLSIEKGNVDYSKLETGKYILVTKMNNSEEESPILYDVGDKVSLNFDDGSKDYEVMAIVSMPYDISIGSKNEYQIEAFLPENECFMHLGEKKPYLCVFNVNDKQEENNTELWLQSFVSNYTQVSYQSRQTYEREFKGLETGIILIGNSLATIIGVIGIINFINIICTSIIKRKSEFKILHMIGMTIRTQYKLVILEGLYYIGFSAVVCISIGLVIASIILKNIEKSFWLYTFHIDYMGIGVTFVIMCVISIFVPYILFKTINSKE